MNFLAMLDKGVFKDPFYKSVIPTFPLAVAWITDFGFLNVGPLARIENPGLFLALALVWHTVQIVVAYILVRWLLARLVSLAEEFRRGGKTIFIAYNAAAFGLINFALLGAALGAAHLLGAPTRITAAHPLLENLAGVNFLWYITAFLVGRELIQLLVTDRYAVPSSVNATPAAEE